MKITVANQEIQIDEQDLHLIDEYKWLYNKKTGYLQVRTNKRTLYLHRLITECPENMQVDHINHDKNDYRRNNLRLVTLNQNLYNKKTYKNSKTGYKGIVQNQFGSYCVQISHQGKRVYVGTFKNLFEAINAYNKASEQYHGVYGRKHSITTLIKPWTEMIVKKLIG